MAVSRSLADADIDDQLAELVRVAGAALVDLRSFGHSDSPALLNAEHIGGSQTRWMEKSRRQTPAKTQIQTEAPPNGASNFLGDVFEAKKKGATGPHKARLPRVDEFRSHTREQMT
jgi:hypothetical protein